jgi:ribosomal protein S25
MGNSKNMEPRSKKDIDAAASNVLSMTPAKAEAYFSKLSENSYSDFVSIGTKTIDLALKTVDGNNKSNADFVSLCKDAIDKLTESSKKGETTEKEKEESTQAILEIIRRTDVSKTETDKHNTEIAKTAIVASATTLTFIGIVGIVAKTALSYLTNKNSK